MPFSASVDPAKIVTIPDMDLSYALASTLVEWSPAKEITAGLASRWEVAAERVYRLTLRDNARWSDGAPLTSKEVKQSFERGFKKYPDDLRGVANLVDHIDCPTDQTIEFHLKAAAKDSGLLERLAEPNYGIVALSADSVNLKRSTGPFYLSESTKDQLVLKVNPSWYRHAEGMADAVLVRRPPKGLDSQTVLLKDTWANLIETSSLMPGEVRKEYDSRGFKVWWRPLDKIFLLWVGNRLRTERGEKIVQYLRANLDRSGITNGLSGFQLTEQMFPQGYQLYDRRFECPNAKIEKPAELSKPLTILITPARVSQELKDNLEKALVSLTGHKPNFISIELSDFSERIKGSDFDFYYGTVGLADPDPAGAMSYYLEGPAPLIGSKTESFLSRFDSARAESDPTKKLDMMRSVLTDATCKGVVLPLFHISTVGIGKAPLDFSEVPITDESVTLSKVRFKNQ